MRSPSHTTDAPSSSESSPGRENGVGLPAGMWSTPQIRELTDYEASQFIREQLGARPPRPEDFSADGRYLLPRKLRNTSARVAPAAGSVPCDQELSEGISSAFTRKDG